MKDSPFAVTVKQDWPGLLGCIKREGKPGRVHFFEIHIDAEVQQAICDRFGLLESVRPEDPFYEHRRNLAVQRILGYDYVCCGLDEPWFALKERRIAAGDTAALRRKGGRAFANEHKGPITNWQEFESFPWPDPRPLHTRSLEWYCEHVPEDMCIVAAAGPPHLPELMGYETLCYALADQRDLVSAIAQRLLETCSAAIRSLLELERVKVILAMDDLGFKGGTLISPEDLRAFILPIHKNLAKLSHDAGRPYVFHCCGKIDAIMPDLLDEVRIDAKHSFEDTIESVIDAKASYGDRIAVLGGIDVDFLCRANQAQIRRRVDQTLAVCLPGGGYCLGTGNSVANYVPLDNYLFMLDQGRKFAA